jgi:hypothetical protein
MTDDNGERGADGACAHTEDQLDESISHLGDPDWAYCFGCAVVLHREGGEWVAQSRPGQITKATFRHG